MKTNDVATNPKDNTAPLDIDNFRVQSYHYRCQPSFTPSITSDCSWLKLNRDSVICAKGQHCGIPLYTCMSQHKLPHTKCKTVLYFVFYSFYQLLHIFELVACEIFLPIVSATTAFLLIYSVHRYKKFVNFFSQLNLLIALERNPAS